MKNFKILRFVNIIIMNFCIDLTYVALPSGENYNNPRHHNENSNFLIAQEIYNLLKFKNIFKN